MRDQEISKANKHRKDEEMRREENRGSEGDGGDGGDEENKSLQEREDGEVDQDLNHSSDDPSYAPDNDDISYNTIKIPKLAQVVFSYIKLSRSKNKIFIFFG